jgi:two-component system sensor histidine kinase/response regulator
LTFPFHPGLLVAIGFSLASAAAGFWGGRLRAARGRASLTPRRGAPSSAVDIESRTTVYQQLAENIPHVFWMANCQEERLVYVSPSMLDLWLVEPQVIINDPSQWLASIHPSDRASAETTLASMLSGAANCCEYRIIRADGEIRAVRNRSFPVRDSEGKVTRVAGIIEDVTSEQQAQRALRESRDELFRHVNELKQENRERRRAETELRAAKELAEAGSRAKSQFLRNISHELRTPLNGIMGMLQLALDADDSEDERQSLQSAAQSAAHLLAIVDDILEFSESESGKIEIAREPFDLRKCVREVANRLAPQIFEKKLEFAYYVSIDVPEVAVGDAKRLAQILSHLFSNAVKFSDSGSIGLEVTRTGEASVQFAVSDTGIGISPDSRTAIFEAFTQVDGSLTRSYGGLGLGLSICARLVAMMGGEMSLDSEPGTGSRFSFTIPLISGTAVPVSPVREPMTGVSVLVIDSSPGPLDIAKRALSDSGLGVTCCSSGEAALEAIRNAGSQPAVILLAGKPSDSDAFAFAERLCTEYRIGHRLFAAHNAQEEPSNHARWKQLHIAGHFPKPLNFDDVRDSIRKLQSAPSAPASSVLAPRAAARGVVKSLPAAAPLRVLLVEDNPINQTVLKRMLQKQGHSVVTADNGRIALETLDELEWDIDLVLMDMQMPELDGYETTARIRSIESERGGHLPIIAATAHAMAGDSERCLSAGMDGYITKPIQMEVLARTIAGAESMMRRHAALERKVS